MLALLLVLLIPPPPDWTPPQASGPGTFCGHTFRLEVAAGETIREDWPGEMFINDVFGTYRLATPRGEVVVTENGQSTLPSGHAKPVGRGGLPFRSFEDGVHVLLVRDNAYIKGVTIRFWPGAGSDESNDVLGRIRAGVLPTTPCLMPQNR